MDIISIKSNKCSIKNIWEISIFYLNVTIITTENYTKFSIILNIVQKSIGDFRGTATLLLASIRKIELML